ncbi:MAG: PEGA domain-containing protein [Sideroxyarcus sp.]
MKRLALYLLAGAAGMFLAGCASLSGNEIQIRESEQQNPDAAKVKTIASIRFANYVDGRNMGNPRKIGTAKVRVLGLSGTELLLDRDVTDVAADSLRKRLNDAGLQVLPPDDDNALFELSGVVKELKYDVKDRDYVLIRLETSLKEIATGKVVWAGEVEQKNDRFAGVSGNNKGDIADYLKQELGVVTGKTAEAINTTLMAKYPEMYNLTPGTKAIPGVTVFVSPNGIGSAAPDTSMLTPIAGAPGMLVVRTEPARAKVYLDGVYYGLSPLNINMAAGIRKVEVKLKGYRNASEKVAIRIGATTELEFQLEK